METNQQAEVAETSPQPEVSIEDRVMAHFEGAQPEEQPEAETTEETEEPATEPEEGAEPEEAESEEELVDLDLDGEIYQMPKKVAEGFLRQQDYTRKTQEVAAERQTLQEQRQSIENERQAFTPQVQAQQQLFQAHANIAAIDAQIAQYNNLDWQQLIDQDPVQAMKLERSLNVLKENRNQAVQGVIQQQQEFSFKQQQEFAQQAEQARTELMKRIPNFNQETAKALREYGTKQGYTENELANLIDPRLVETLHKAYLYDQLQAGKPETLKKVSAATKTIKPGAQQPKQNTQDVLKKVIKTSTDKHSKNAAIQKLLESRL